MIDGNREDCTEMLKRLLNDYKSSMFISTAARVGDTKALNSELSKGYINCFDTMDFAFIRVLLDANIPISENNRKKGFEDLIKWDELKLAKRLQELPIDLFT